MQPTREIQGLLAGILVALALIGVVATYWAVVGPETILQRDDNPRLVEQRAGVLRGRIVDRNDNILATSVQDDQGKVTREYPFPSMYSALGYYSLRYGEGGAEAAYDNILDGDARARTFDDFIDEELLHLAREGTDIRLTFDLAVQNRVSELMAGHRGAVVVLSVPDGAVMAMLSLPTYDPNLLDSNWDTFIESDGDLFFNRALQGNYQPGNSTYTVVVATALSHEIALETVFANADRAVIVDDLILNCGVEPPSDRLSLVEAYGYGCPGPFTDLIGQIGLADIASTFQQFHPKPSFTLPGFLTEINNTESDATNISQQFTIGDALGQGGITFTPLQQATIIAAIINYGNAPEPYTLLATRQPETDQWAEENAQHKSIPIMSAQVAQQLGELMQRNVVETFPFSSVDDGIRIGGQAALAYSGEQSHVWFSGFAQQNTNTGVVATVVIEDSNDLNLATQIGRDVLLAATSAQ